MLKAALHDLLPDSGQFLQISCYHCSGLSSEKYVTESFERRILRHVSDLCFACHLEYVRISQMDNQDNSGIGVQSTFPDISDELPKQV